MADDHDPFDPAPPPDPVTLQAPKRRGRPPGSGKVPGSGSVKGHNPRAARAQSLSEMRLEVGRAPVAFLVDVVEGKRMIDGHEIELIDGRPKSVPKYAFPPMKLRVKAAETLLARIMPVLSAAAVQLDGDMAVKHAHSGEAIDPMLLAQQIIFACNSGFVPPDGIRAIRDLRNAPLVEADDVEGVTDDQA